MHSPTCTTFCCASATFAAMVGRPTIWSSSGQAAAGSTMSASSAVGVMKRSAFTMKSSFISDSYTSLVLA
ncbi:MAG: hypothetical protein M5U08_03455 [Burkholderiales bacterium]|nr:hypothetical protein [Burkholderiales bacterium]